MHRLLALLLALSHLAACASAPTRDAQTLTIDGELADWDNDFSGIRSDASHVVFSFASHDPSQAIQAATYTTRIAVDADDDPTTGRQDSGAELVIELSPRRDNGSLSGGVRVTTYTPSGRAERVSHADAGFMALPTHNAPRYEARLDRTSFGLDDDGPISITIDAVGAKGRVLSTQSLRAEALGGRAHTPVRAVPSAPSGATRVMALNVLYSQPLKTPGPFKRITEALEPDVILYQEWFRSSADDVDRWVTDNLGDGWTLAGGHNVGGIAIATTLDVLGTWTLEPEKGSRSAPRAVAALLRDGSHELIAVSVHLKCCGGANSDEDLRRIREASAINELVAQIRETHPAAGVVIAGDYNLVGTRAPLETMAQGIGAQGSDLVPAPSVRLGDHSAVTWTNPESSFSPGRLDWALVDTTSASIVNAFTFDTRVLSDALLDDLGLERDDSAATDHLPLIVDLDWND